MGTDNIKAANKLMNILENGGFMVDNSLQTLRDIYSSITEDYEKSIQDLQQEALKLQHKMRCRQEKYNEEALKKIEKINKEITGNKEQLKKYQPLLNSFITCKNIQADLINLLINPIQESRRQQLFIEEYPFFKYSW